MKLTLFPNFATTVIVPSYSHHPFDKEHYWNVDTDKKPSGKASLTNHINTTIQIFL